MGESPQVFPPVDMTPKVEPKPTPAPVVTPPVGTPTNYVKPSGATEVKPVEVKPVVAETVPKTSFDVDMYEPKSSDTWPSISQDYYNNKSYAAALEAYNKSLGKSTQLQGGQPVDIPPIHVLKKRFPTLLGNVPTGSTNLPPPGASATSAPEWGAPPKPDPAPVRPTATGRGTYLVPQGGLTMEAVARLVGVPWQDVYDLNPMYRTGVVLPAGTELRMPATARLP